MIIVVHCEDFMRLEPNFNSYNHRVVVSGSNIWSSGRTIVPNVGTRFYHLMVAASTFGPSKDNFFKAYIVLKNYILEPLSQY